MPRSTSGKRFKAAARFECGPPYHSVIVMLPRAPPRRPTPHVCVVRKIVAAGEIRLDIRVGRTANCHNTLMIAVPFEQVRTVGEEIIRRKTVIFQDDPLWLMLEE